MSNALDFISAYNVIDARMRALYRGKGNLQFSDLVRRCAEINRTVRKHEEELLTFARLRNAIVHNSVRERIIAEPCNEVTELITRIADLLSAPPRLGACKRREITCLDGGESLSDAVRKMAKTGFSNLPVYRGGRMIGILNNRRFVRAMGEALERGEDMDGVLALPCERILREEDVTRYYCVLGPKDTVEEALDAFEKNRRLLAVIVTETGTLGGEILNLITASDLPVLIRMLEE